MGTLYEIKNGGAHANQRWAAHSYWSAMSSFWYIYAEKCRIIGESVSSCESERAQ